MRRTDHEFAPAAASHVASSARVFRSKSMPSFAAARPVGKAKTTRDIRDKVAQGARSEACRVSIGGERMGEAAAVDALIDRSNRFDGFLGPVDERAQLRVKRGDLGD